MRRLSFVGTFVVATLSFMPTAGAAQQYYNTMVGQFSVPNLPVRLCLGASCQTTPPLKSFLMNVQVVTDDTSTPPVMVKGACPSGVGGTVTVTAGSGPAAVAAYISGTRPDGSPFLAFTPSASLPPGGTVVASACTT